MVPSILERRRRYPMNRFAAATIGILPGCVSEIGCAGSLQCWISLAVLAPASLFDSVNRLDPYFTRGKPPIMAEFRRFSPPRTKLTAAAKPLDSVNRHCQLRKLWTSPTVTALIHICCPKASIHICFHSPSLNSPQPMLQRKTICDSLSERRTTRG
ncbi:hypothetical protein OK349_07115 [Sphingomonas sp. BT-65]|uniref:hypothetical protein n=1 Tax=Sphingomonas sp. BT-65 TaxID=2989821 RepID=UPI002236A29D|nr:hypothetical protein [Sphingomonas sp. BT-65]MCW4461473.1 hypothetical protein [Sphingomonas sp. BT-65]